MSLTSTLLLLLQSFKHQLTAIKQQDVAFGVLVQSSNELLKSFGQLIHGCRHNVVRRRFQCLAFFLDSLLDRLMGTL